MSRAASELGMPVMGIELRFLLPGGSRPRKRGFHSFKLSLTGSIASMCGLTAEPCSVGHDLGDAQQDDEGEEQQVDIGLHLAGMAQPADLIDDLLARGRR